LHVVSVLPVTRNTIPFLRSCHQNMCFVQGLIKFSYEFIIGV
jgi:hypothetical protein